MQYTSSHVWLDYRASMGEQVSKEASKQSELMKKQAR